MSKIQQIADEFIQKKSEKTFRVLINRLTPGILNKISQLETDPEKRQEIANIVFAKAWKNIDQYSTERGAFSTWIYRIAYTECLLEKRHSNRVKSLDRMLEEGTVKESSLAYETDFENFDEKPDFDVVGVLYDKTVSAIHQISDEGRDGIIKTALIKWHIDKKPYKTIAEEMNIPENSAKNKVFRGKSLLRKMIIAREPELVRLFEQEIK